jgi:hypothetical protein
MATRSGGRFANARWLCCVVALAPLAFPAFASSIAPAAILIWQGTQHKSPLIIAAPGSFRAGERVTIVSVPSLVRYCCATVIAQTAKRDERITFTSNQQKLVGYRVTIKAVSMVGSIAFVLRGDSHVTRSGNTEVSLNPRGNANQLRMSYCTSSEGVHLTAWEQVDTSRHRLWHAYYYLGQDLESTCTPDQITDFM